MKGGGDRSAPKQRHALLLFILWRLERKRSTRSVPLLFFNGCTFESLNHVTQSRYLGVDIVDDSNKHTHLRALREQYLLPYQASAQDGVDPSAVVMRGGFSSNAGLQIHNTALSKQTMPSACKGPCMRPQGVLQQAPRLQTQRICSGLCMMIQTHFPCSWYIRGRQ